MLWERGQLLFYRTWLEGLGECSSWGSCASAVFLGVLCRPSEILQLCTCHVVSAQHREQDSAVLASIDHEPSGRRCGGYVRNVAGLNKTLSCSRTLEL